MASFKGENCTLYLNIVSRFIKSREKPGKGSTVPLIELIKDWKGRKISLGYFNLTQMQVLLKTDSTTLAKLNSLMDKKNQDADKTTDNSGSTLQFITTQGKFADWLMLFDESLGPYLKSLKNYI
jgi:hypothetical protein